MILYTPRAEYLATQPFSMFTYCTGLQLLPLQVTTDIFQSVSYSRMCRNLTSATIVHRTLVPLGFTYAVVALSYFVLGTPSGSTLHFHRLNVVRLGLQPVPRMVATLHRLLGVLCVIVLVHID